MRKKIIFFIVMIVVCLAGWGLYLYYKPHQGVSAVKPDISIGATSLYEQYAGNEAEANNKFLNKVIAVQGSVAGITTTDSTTHILLVAEGSSPGGISCSLFGKERLKLNVQPGDSLTIKGRCTGFLMDVVLTDCVIE